MKIGIDIADTIIDVWPNIMEKADEFNKNHSNNQKNDKSFLYLPEDIYNWTEEERKEFWISYGQDITFSAPIKTGVQETLEYLKRLKYIIYFVTAKSNDVYANLESKIIKLLNDNSLPYDYIYTQISNKGEFCYEKELNYLIDDSYTNCFNAISNGAEAFLVSNIYNLNRETPEKMIRINEFNEIKQYIKK